MKRQIESDSDLDVIGPSLKRQVDVDTDSDSDLDIMGPTLKKSMNNEITPKTMNNEVTPKTMKEMTIQKSMKEKSIKELNTEELEKLDIKEDDPKDVPSINTNPKSDSLEKHPNDPIADSKHSTNNNRQNGENASNTESNSTTKSFSNNERTSNIDTSDTSNLSHPAAPKDLSSFTSLEPLYLHSYKQPSNITAMTVSPDHSLIVVGLQNGTVQFWKQTDDEIECFKQFLGTKNKLPVKQLLFSKRGTMFVAVSTEVKLFDVTTLDMILVVKLPFAPNVSTSVSNTWVGERLVISEHDLPRIYVVDPFDGTVEETKQLHRTPIQSIVCIDDVIVSSDAKGIIEYWRLDGSPPNVTFKYKAQTDLFALAKCKQKALCASVDDTQFAVLTENNVRVFDFMTGKCLRTVEADTKYGIRKQVTDILLNKGKYLLYSCNGVVIVDLETDKTLARLGSTENLNFEHIGLLNKVDLSKVDIEKFSLNNALIEAQLTRKTMVVASSRNLLYTFTSSPVDIHARNSQKGTSKPVTGCIIHTNMGDITIKFFKLTPKTTDNFIALCRRKYYNNVIFHRVIKGFMIQTGDPRGDGTGGESAWGGHFEDEFHRLLNHNKPFMVSMANAGPNTNGSQFFITTEPAQHLNNKHTVFGEVTQGFDVVRAIEDVETENDTPKNMVAILSTTLI